MQPITTVKLDQRLLPQCCEKQSNTLLKINKHTNAPIAAYSNPCNVTLN